MSSDPNIKHRVTGAIVLIALAVIFLPLILDGKKKNQIIESKIPDAPIEGEIILLSPELAENAQKDDAVTRIDLSQTEPPNDSEEKTPVQESLENETAVVNSQEMVEVEISDPIQPAAKPEPERMNRPNYQKSGYVVQVGSFSKKANADALVDKLVKAKYRAYTKPANINGRTIHRVLVGPEHEKSTADGMLAALSKLSGATAKVYAYDPLKH